MLATVAAAFGLLFFITDGLAKTNNTWQQSIPLGPPLSGRILYGELGGMGDRAFYYFTVTKPTTVTIQLAIPTWAGQRWQPRLVLYRPESTTIGPSLPMAQPPETAATVYPADDWVIVTDPLSSIEYRRVLKTTIEFPQPGRHWLAIYNAGQAGGRWRLTFTGPATFAKIATWPGQWWRDQAWAGWALPTMLLPLWVMAAVIVLWLLTHRHPATKRRPNHVPK